MDEAADDGGLRRHTHDLVADWQHAMGMNAVSSLSTLMR
jgi:hypothetical protein